MSQVLETVTIYRDGQPVVINKSDLKDTDKQAKEASKDKQSNKKNR